MATFGFIGGVIEKVTKLAGALAYLHIEGFCVKLEGTKSFKSESRRLS